MSDLGDELIGGLPAWIFDPRIFQTCWFRYTLGLTAYLEDLERRAGRIYRQTHPLSSRLPERFFWRYAYPRGSGWPAYPVLEIWPMAANTWAPNYALGPRVIMPDETVQNHVIPQRLSRDELAARVRDVLDNVQAAHANNDDNQASRTSSNRLASPFASFMDEPPVMDPFVNQPLTFDELDEFNFLLNDQTDDQADGQTDGQMGGQMDGTEDRAVTDNTTNSRRFSPPTRSISSRSWSSNETSLFGSTTQSTSNRNGGFVDLTADSSPPPMALHLNRRTAPRSQASRDTSNSPSNPAKKRKTANGAVRGGATSEPQPPVEIEEVDLRAVDDDTGLSRLLAKQRENTIKAQQEQEGKPLNLANLQCIVCMEPMFNITATHCGKSIH